jgi:hypothetical protein
MPGPPLYRYPPVHQPRPINPFDNASTTGLYSNPNGTYIANPFPTTGQSGAQGAFAAGLPTVQVGGGQTWIQKAASMAGSNYQAGQTWAQQAANIARGPLPLPQRPIRADASPLAAPGSAQESRGSQYADQPTRGGSSVLDSYNYQRRTGQLSTDVMQFIVNDPKSYENLSPAQKEAVDRIVGNGQQGGGGTPGAGQFYGYERNEETGKSERVIKDSSTSSFSKELRWDPDRKKYVEIGKLMKEGKLDKKGGWHKKKKGGGSNGGSGRPPPGPKAGWTGSYGVVNFNTGSG